MVLLRDRTSARLARAMKERDRDAIAVCRRVLAAFSNAEAIPSAAVAGAVEAAAPPGSVETEVARAVITEQTMIDLANEELDDLVRFVDDASRFGADDRSAAMARQVDVLKGLLEDSTADAT